MQIIKLKSGHEVFIDDCDLHLFDKYVFYALKQSHTYYARAVWYVGEVRHEIKLHRLILGLTDKKIHVDHKDGNGLNNMRDNLRICNHSDNMRNRSPRGSSKYMGVSKHPGGWLCRINTNGKQTHLGLFSTEEDAALAYNEAAIKSGNTFFRLNKL